MKQCVLWSRSTEQTQKTLVHIHGNTFPETMILTLKKETLTEKKNYFSGSTSTRQERLHKILV